jgi:hypothetical protein
VRISRYPPSGSITVQWKKSLKTLLSYWLKTVVSIDITVLVSGSESKNIIFTCGDSKNHLWPSPRALVIFPSPLVKTMGFLPNIEHISFFYILSYHIICQKNDIISFISYRENNDMIDNHISFSYHFKKN